MHASGCQDRLNLNLKAKTSAKQLTLAPKMNGLPAPSEFPIVQFWADLRVLTMGCLAPEQQLAPEPHVVVNILSL